MKGSPFTLKASFDVSDRQSKKCLRCGERERQGYHCVMSHQRLSLLCLSISPLYFFLFLVPLFASFYSLFTPSVSLSSVFQMSV